ncbi:MULTISPECIES: hypothetical protein [Franconibacter]|jgi:hypothetical protein|uniref:Uncharacterized protein n=1 Tax=Franconibacter daqui TaxID=2047724 RepID=A0ABV1PPL4_9ENTR|nr:MULTISPECIES: hypothetical protein [Franconibacter]MCK1966949.1 hypothetical protein [Franconibacter sp. IITDAS19]MEB5921641.1 hypothetical protein [Franconibacter daqui]GGD07329.1 hypothetical protein GCM10011513_01170 [Franconibacter daqui]
MKFFYFVALIAAVCYLFAFLPRAKTDREPIAWWGCWAYVGASALYWAYYGLDHYLNVF